MEGTPDLRVKAIVDDGTGALTAIFPRALTERLIGRSLDEALAEARERMVSGSREERMEASNKLTGALRTLFAIAENYPDLKASENFKLLQEQLEGIESKIAYARQYYNSSVLIYNNVITTIPGAWFAGGRRKHAFLEIPGEERRPVKVEF
jgi:LemA protein